MSRLRILLLQARTPDDAMKAHEHACFVERSGLPPEDVVCHNLAEGAPDVARLHACDALTVGGSGDFYVSRGNLPEFEETLAFLRAVVDEGYPTFASCFGFQALVRAGGGEIVHDPPNKEVGTYELTLTDAGRDDPLFGTLPPTFMAQMGHKERATRLPAGWLNMASSVRCPYQGLRVPGKPVWATQFHPELDRETNLDRFRRYLADYGPGAVGDVEAVMAGFKPSPEASGLIGTFLDVLRSRRPGLP